MADSAASTPPGLIGRVIAKALTLKPVRAVLLYMEHRGPVLADSVTYRTLFSLFAAVLLGFSLAAAWLSGNPQALRAIVDAVDSVIPGLVGEGGAIDLSLIREPAGLSIATAISTIALIGAAIGAIGSLRTAIRNIADKLMGDVFFVFVLLRNLLLAVVLGLLLVAGAAASFLGTTFVGTVNGWLGISTENPLSEVVTTLVSVLVVFVLDAVVIAVAFLMLSGLKPSLKALLPGALYGAVGLTVLQQLSALFVGGATSNPLLATFGTLIALLIWINLSVQVILLASAYIVTGVDDETDRVRSRYGASTFGQRRVRRAEIAVMVATSELDDAREFDTKERAATAAARATAAAKEGSTAQKTPEA